MKFLNLYGSLILVVTLSACSSDPSDKTDPATQINTNTDESGTTASGGNTSAGPSDDAPGNATESGQTTTDNTDESTDLDTSADQNTDQDASSDAETDDPMEVDTGSGPANGDVGDTSDTGSTDDTDTGTSSDGGDTTAPVDTGSAIDPATPLGELEDFIQILTARTLIALNKSMSQGELLSEQQENCLGSYEPAIGQPLISVDCGDSPLATGNVPIYASIASFKDSPECRASLQSEHADGCKVDQALLTVNTKWYQTDRRPQPKAGATISYNIEQNLLQIENLPNMLTGAFNCQYDLTGAEPAINSQFGNCDDTILIIISLIEDHLTSQLP